MYILFELSWSAVFIGTGAASYKRFGSGESVFLALFCKLSGAFMGVFV